MILYDPEPRAFECYGCGAVDVHEHGRFCLECHQDSGCDCRSVDCPANACTCAETCYCTGDVCNCPPCDGCVRAKRDRDEPAAGAFAAWAGPQCECCGAPAILGHFEDCEQRRNA